MGALRDKHLRAVKDRGTGWDRKSYSKNPNDLTIQELREELLKRKLSPEGNRHELLSRFTKALAIGIPVGGREALEVTRKFAPQDKTGVQVAFLEPEDPKAYGCISVTKKGRLITHNDGVKPTWTTIRAYYPVPDGKILRWTLVFPKLFCAVVGITRDPVKHGESLGDCGDTWGYCINMQQKRHNGSDETYGVPVGPNQKVTCIVDHARGTVAYEVNGQSLGVAFEGVVGTVYPSVSMLGISEAVLLDHSVTDPAGTAPDIEAAAPSATETNPGETPPTTEEGEPSSKRQKTE